jgi:uncharacterized protein DUF2844
MMSRSINTVLVILVVGFSPLGAGSARAALGGDLSSVLADGVDMHGTVNSLNLVQYDVQEIAPTAGTRVREYLNRNGIVFAVSWTGPVAPDLQRLLGTHFKEYTTALAALNHPGSHRSVRVVTPELVVESGGHLRAYFGRAYLTALIPAGVPAADLR